LIRASSQIRVKARKGYTLLEVLLALGLSGLLMVLVYGAMQTFWSLSSTGKIDAERCQLARTLIRRMEMDIRSITYKPDEPQAAESEGQAADEGASAAEEGVSAAEDTSTPTVEPAPAPVEITEDDTYLVAGVHLIGTSQSLEMIVLRPTRNRSGSQEDAVFAATESDRRKVGYMFSTGAGGVPGLYYRNVDQQYELMMEQQGSPVDALSEYVLLAAEVADLQFQYLDGGTNTWVDQWHSRDLAGLPRAIRITMVFHAAAMASTNQLRNASTHVSTEVFQTVVQLPMSEVPLEL
jgi:prepilin-type N-terminal cleavage/methylation domain-containing protein